MSKLIILTCIIRNQNDLNDKNQSQTATVQYQNALMDKFIEDAGDDIIDDDNHDESMFYHDNNSAQNIKPSEKPSFFETSVDIPPYLKSSILKQKANKIHQGIFSPHYIYNSE